MNSKIVHRLFCFLHFSYHHNIRSKSVSILSETYSKPIVRLLHLTGASAKISVWVECAAISPSLP